MYASRSPLHERSRIVYKTEARERERTKHTHPSSTHREKVISTVGT